MERSQEVKKDLLRRISKVEGQIRGIHRMVEEDRYCVDVLVQISAARAGLQKVALAILGGHTRGCVANAIRSEQGEEYIEELINELDKFIK